MLAIDRIIRSRRKTIALIVELDGRLVLRAPLHVADDRLRELVDRKESWIRSRQEAMRLRPAFSPPHYVEGQGFWYLGERYPLHLVDHRSPPLVFDDGFLLSRLVHPRARELFERWYREQARRVILKRVQYFAARHGCFYQSLRITSARTRWGSCSTRGTLSFAWRLVMAPSTVIDYVVLHELVHLKVHNHSRKFWSKLEGLLPDYRDRKAWLDQNGHLLRLE